MRKSETTMDETTIARISVNSPCGSNYNDWSNWDDMEVPNTLLREFRERVMEHALALAKEYREELEAEMAERILWEEDRCVE